MTSAGVNTGASSFPGIGVFARKVPFNLLKREPSLVEPELRGRGCWAGLTAGRGMVSTLVEAETSVGEEIWLGLMRLRVDPLSSFVCEGDFKGGFIKAAVAASTRR